MKGIDCVIYRFIRNRPPRPRLAISVAAMAFVIILGESQRQQLWMVYRTRALTGGLGTDARARHDRDPPKWGLPVASDHSRRETACEKRVTVRWIGPWVEGVAGYSAAPQGFRIRCASSA
jgi:hypothetical protein